MTVAPISIIPAQAGIQKDIKNIFNSFCFAKSKALATVFLDQARKRQRTYHAVVSSLWDTPRIFVLLGHFWVP
jgi:hypothetical protein